MFMLMIAPQQGHLESRGSNGTEKMAQWVECWLYKREDQSSDPQHQGKCQVGVAVSLGSSADDVVPESPWTKLLD